MARFGFGRGFLGMLAMSSMATVAGCGGAHGGRDAQAPAAATLVHACSSGSGAKTKVEPIGRPGTSATVALAKIAGRRVAFVADEDAKAIQTLDLDSGAELASTPIGGVPGQVYVTKDGRVFATVRDQNVLVMLSAVRADAPLEVACGVTTPAEPIAIGATPNDDKLVVTSGWGERVSVFDAATLTKKGDVAVPREPRSVVLADDGKTAFVSHAVGSQLTVVSLDKLEKLAAREVPLRPLDERAIVLKKQQKRSSVELEQLFAKNPQVKHLAEGRESCQGFALAKSSAIGGRIFAPEVAVEPGDPSSRPAGYGDHSTETEMPNVAVLDEATGTPMASSMELAEDRFFGRQNERRDARPPCLLPRAAAVDPASKALLVTCYGIDAVVAYDATAATPTSAERHRWSVGAGPSGVAIDTEKARGVVWSQFDRTLSSFALGVAGAIPVDDGNPNKEKPLEVKSTKLAALSSQNPELVLGRILFHAAGDPRISHDGRACASCHPDGRDDAITWATPEGPRRSIMLAGRVMQSSPYSWNGNETTLKGHLGNTFDRLSGAGLRSVELDALVAYVSSLPPPPPSSAASADAANAKKVARGREIFASTEAACATCHSGANFSDGLNHDVGSKAPSDRGVAFNTPSLHLVGGTGPYFHDGRYATLSELLVKSDGKMGHTKQLSNADLESLESYLKTL